MGALARASLFIVSMLCLQLECNSEVFQKNQRNLPEPSRHQFYLVGSGVPEQQSASELQPPNRLRLSSTNYLLGNVKHDQNFPLDNPHYYENMERQVGRNMEQTQPQAFPEADDGNDGIELDDHALMDSFEDYKTAQSSYFMGQPMENMQNDHYYGRVRPYDDDEYKHEHHEKHKEVHYHKHKHHHKHEHKQEHKHHHKQGHEHKHIHEQHHKHEHHQKHEHGHKHKHGHHQHHKHDHHHGHKHGHHHGHKHEHKHGHKHEHHNEHKHHHKHGHKHGHKHEHKHHSKHH